MNQRKDVSWIGWLLITLALALFLGALLLEDPFEPLFVFGVVLLLPIGVYLATEGRKAAMSREELLKIRSAGPGKPGSPERENWINAQIQRARSIRFTVLAVLFGSIALYLCTHVAGAVWSRTNETSPLRWRTHAERLKKTDSSTQAGDTLARVALANDLTVAELARVNRAAQLEILEDLPSVVTDGRTLKRLPEAKAESPTGIDPIGATGTTAKAQTETEAVTKTETTLTTNTAATAQAAATTKNEKPVVTTLEAASRQLGITPEEVAVEFPTATLVGGQTLQIPVRTSADPLQWYDWFLWALVGLAASLLLEIGRHTRLIFEGEGDFIGETPWYWAQLTTGPLIAFAILLLFTHIDLDLLTSDETAVEVNLHRYPIDLLIVPAFLLGFYSLVAREVLDQLMRTIFRASWRAVYGNVDFKISIRDHNGDDEIASQVVFETRPPATVTWSATAGTINAAGVYQPPPIAAGPIEVFVTAIPTTGGNGAVTRKFIIVKHKFQIVTPKDATISPSQKLKLEIAPTPADQEKEKVTWRVVKGPEGSTISSPGFEVELFIPADAPPGERVKVEATYEGLTRSAELIIGAALAPSTPGVLTIQAQVDSKPLKDGDSVPPGANISLVASGLAAEKAPAVDWTTSSAGLSIEPSQGAITTAIVTAPDGEIEVVAKHPDALPGSLKLAVKAG